ncbi:Exopolysaccharide biosynthesis polyprenyl glycosylphosphotransferase [Nostocoides japonicum T1-X7]|uniref:Exopolysaccharide biosynthesis polyprenyl glycosylphosphotransferase n=1 Tax=Nostocoides japonicum T1-X7 TaxID=1194083 RepID=A0A077LWM9_9MICO|nr:Exopolysaccharide biosynthesis polyprenyl glycosylphosphotransferase [Tetrasphaera japonica T1-X7]
MDLVESGHAVVKHGLAGWQRRYRTTAVVADLLGGAVVSFGAAALRHAMFGGQTELWLASAASTKIAVLLMPIAWVLCLARAGAYAPRYLGTGNEEYRAIMRAMVVLLAMAAVLLYALKLDLSRAYALIALPSLVIVSLVLRWLLRDNLARARQRGKALQPTLVVGRVDTVGSMIHQIHFDPAGSGLRVVGACVSEVDPDRPLQRTVDGVPVLGGPEETLRAVDELGAAVVAVASTPELAGDSLRRLGWSLEYRDVDLLVAPGIVGVAGPRLSLRPANGLPMLHVERPLTGGISYRLKAIVDRLLALLAVAVLAPVFAVIWVLIRVDSRGPALYRQERIGSEGRPFTMLKFRSMVVDAESRLPELVDRSDGNGRLFKMREDPRVTRVGRVLRKFSLDELPQLFNVVAGQMSLVGPRPPLGREVDEYEFDAVRRLRVLPGMTGLWQVSGRSDLSWEDSLRLDLWYVDNWSLTLDLQIISRTFRAVFKGSGAY